MTPWLVSSSNPIMWKYHCFFFPLTLHTISLDCSNTNPRMSINKGKAAAEGSSSISVTTMNNNQQQQPTLSRYESQKRRDWNTFGQYLSNQRPPIALTQFTTNQVLEFLQYLDQFGKTKVHVQGCPYFGQPEPPRPCPCPLKQAWGSLDALIGRLRAAYEENGGIPEANPFANSSIRNYLREVRESQAKARGILYKKRKKRKNTMRPKGEDSASSIPHQQLDSNFPHPYS